MNDTINQIADSSDITLEQLAQLLTTDNKDIVQYLYDTAHATAQQYFGNKIFMRGLIEISNHCKNDCLYCGIRRSQKEVHRYRLSKEEILDCCQQGYGLGFRTYVLQGGEDGWFDDDRLCDIVATIRQ